MVALGSVLAVGHFCGAPEGRGGFGQLPWAAWHVAAWWAAKMMHWVIQIDDTLGNFLPCLNSRG